MEGVWSDHQIVWALDRKVDGPGGEQDDAPRARSVEELEDERAIRCRECALDLADPRDVFSRTAAGPVGLYVNPALFLHEVLTVAHTRGLLLEGEATAEHSWFGGYTWTIAVCGRCRAHIGWRYDAVSPGLEPAMFWGLRRDAIRVTGAS